MPRLGVELFAAADGTDHFHVLGDQCPGQIVLHGVIGVDVKTVQVTAGDVGNQKLIGVGLQMTVFVQLRHFHVDFWSGKGQKLLASADPETGEGKRTGLRIA